MDQALQSGHTTESGLDVMRRLSGEAVGTVTTASLMDNNRGSITKGDDDHTHADNTNLQTIKEFTANNDDIELVLDGTTWAQSTTITVQEKTDGTNYRIVSSAVFPTDFDGPNVIVRFNGKGLDQKVTAQSGTGEGAARNIPFNWVEVNRT